LKTVLSNISSLAIAAIFCGHFISCKKGNPVKSENQASGPIITDTTLFVDVTLDGIRYLGLGVLGDSSWNWGPVDIREFNQNINKYCPLGSFTSGLGYFGQNSSWFSENLPQFYFTSNIEGLDKTLHNQNSTSVFSFTLPFVDSLFSRGNYPYALNTKRDTSFSDDEGSITFSDTTVFTRKVLSSGILLTFIDSNGSVWQTTNGSDRQNGSAFTITGNNPKYSPSFNGYTSSVITANFNCILYDNSGDSMQLTNGKFRLQVNLFNW
jgi:hypothetical protein